MNRSEAKAVIDAINQMFKQDSFSICTVDDCMRVTGSIRTQSYDALRLYHCRKFQSMDADAKEFVMRATMENVMNCCEFPEIRLVEPESHAVVIEEKKSLLQRMLGR